ncbi:MAG TPA: hypothetical protein VJA82_09085 [Sediminibacterium sp.]|uniref:hypothetical protein n=1 Tax=Sediminibacterium sp. TaxID=1917865 RepID=UPI0008CE3170|nr:hypothetical protein [Sediminibacterium sp.]OHC84832.1 MAG: hypothetical protein A2472_14110 [Sphingobacteriia bacterium RIFOXYC2_FULL_35_18]OHC88907.1 MAG: hypothetical protein A2546_06205 [Sphingobacteriia bacterium RIFOXYD2_FULL_35_12]HLD53446.1 hypothetical protein [Sediminibacterium sp.]
MEDNTGKENLENPTNNQPEKSPHEIIPTIDTKSINLNQETENMEVHHHANHEVRKNWKSYFWEFLMLFLAVFCGFLAEWQLEHVIEHSREKEFINSMIEDAQIDTANINKAINENKMALLYIDSLMAVCFNYENQKTNDYEIYQFYRRTISSINFLKPTERTLLQLKNAGGMRLIRKKVAADIIIFYDGIEKDVQSQQENVDKLVYDYITASFEFFNFKYLNPGTYIGVSPEAKLLNHNNLKLTYFGNKLAAFGGTFANYNFKLQEMKENAVMLINTLREEYHLIDK